MQLGNLHSKLPWWPGWLDRGALINVAAQSVLHQWFKARCGTSRKVFHPGVQ